MEQRKRTDEHITVVGGIVSVDGGFVGIGIASAGADESRKLTRVWSLD